MSRYSDYSDCSDAGEFRFDVDGGEPLTEPYDIKKKNTLG